jgi:beta-glucosidase
LLTVRFSNPPLKRPNFVKDRWFDAKKITPRYEFGFGLSYSTFAYSSLSIKASRQKRAGLQLALGVPSSSSSLWSTAVTVTFSIKNTSKLGGNEVAQLYLGFPSSAKEPVRILRGFERVYIAAGKSAKVTLELTRKVCRARLVSSLLISEQDISIWDVKLQSWVVPSGTFEVSVGSSSRKLPLVGSFSQ